MSLQSLNDINLTKSKDILYYNDLFHACIYATVT